MCRLLIALALVTCWTKTSLAQTQETSHPQNAPTPQSEPQQGSTRPKEIARQIAEKYAAAGQYAFSAHMVITRQIIAGPIGHNPTSELADAKVKLAAAPGGKYWLKVEEGQKNTYQLISDGKTRWMYVPAMKKYTEQTGASTQNGSAQLMEDPQQFPRPELMALASSAVVPAVGGMTERMDDAFISGPTLSVITKKGERETQDLFYIRADPYTLKLLNVTWLRSHISNGKKVIVRIEAEFSDFEAGSVPPGTEFSFTPPRKAKKVEALSLPPVKPAPAR